MKKQFFFAAVALVALASCSSEEIIGDSPTPNPNGNGPEKAIVFSSGANAITRATWTGGKAAEMLNKTFVFAGTKGTSASSYVFDQYTAKYVANTANTTESNSNDWEYVGQTLAPTTSLASGAAQTIKYWDYATTQYDFAAYSFGKGHDADGNPATTNDITYATATDNAGNKSPIAAGNKSYSLSGTAEQLKACYISDLVTAYNRDNVNDYGKVVTFSFRSLAAKIRLAFYETVPGYSVKSVQFYNKAEFTPATGVFGTSGTASNVPTLLTANDVATLPNGEGTMTITFPNTGFTKRPGGTEADTDYNKAHIAFTKKNDSDLSASMTFGTALAGFTTERDGVLDPSGNYIGRASNTATYAGGIDPATGAGKYYTVLPNEAPANLMIRIKYTLVATDGSGEEITVNNASAVIPAELAKWSPNYAYTYIFKISDLTNGSTGSDGSGNIVCGLTPITLNAVVVDSEDGLQETITTVSHPSITTYTKGKVVTDNNEYNTGAPIYIIVNNGTANEELTTTNAKLYTAVATNSIQSITEESVDNALRYGVISTTTTTDDTYTVTDAKLGTLVVTDVTPADNTSDPDTGIDWLVKKILKGDSPTGNEIVLDASKNKAAKFTPTTAGTYVFQFQVAAGTANSLSPVAPAKLTSGTNYYTSNAGAGEFTATGSEIVTPGAYYTKGDDIYVLVQAASLTDGNTYYTSDAGAGEFVFHTGDDKDPKTTNYYEKVAVYNEVACVKLTAGTTYYTSNRGAGAFTATGSEVVDAENKYYSGTLGTPAKYQYKIIKVQ